MRTFTIWCVFLCVFLSVAIAKAEKVVPSPSSPQVLAKITQTSDAGQQLYISYNRGQSWERITWFGKSGQVVNFQWSASGWLFLEADNISVKYKIGKNYTHNMTEGRSLGVVNPIEKVIYWVGGFYANEDWGANDATKAKWVDGNTIAFKLISFTPSRYEEHQKKIKLTKKVLSAANQDYAPKMMHLGWSVIAITRQGKNPTSFLQGQKVKFETGLKGYLANNTKRQYVAKYFEVRVEEDIFTRLNNQWTTVDLAPLPNLKVNIAFDICSFGINQKTKVIIGSSEG